MTSSGSKPPWLPGTPSDGRMGQIKAGGWLERLAGCPHYEKKPGRWNQPSCLRVNAEPSQLELHGALSVSKAERAGGETGGAALFRRHAGVSSAASGRIPSPPPGKNVRSECTQILPFLRQRRDDRKFLHWVCPRWALVQNYLLLIEAKSWKESQGTSSPTPWAVQETRFYWGTFVIIVHKSC